MALGTKAGSIYLDMNLNQKGFNTQLNGIKSTASKAGSTVAAAFGSMAGGIVGGAIASAVASLAQEVVAFSKGCIELGSDLAEVQNVVDVAFPTMSKQIDAFAKDAAKSFGLSETMAKRFSGTFGSMATAFGFSEKEAASMATTLTGLAGDLASFYNISQDEAYTKLKSVFTGETESLKDLGVVMSQTALDQYALANGFGKTTKAMSEGEKVALRYAFVQDQLTNAAGDFTRTSDSWANQVRILSLQFDTLKATLGQGLINVLAPILKFLNLIIERLIVAAKAFTSFTSLLTKKGSETNTSNLSMAAASADNLNSATAAASDNLSSATSSAKELKRTLAGFDQITKVDAESGSSSGGNSGTGGLSLVDDAIADATKEEASDIEDKISKLPSIIKGIRDGILDAKQSLEEFNKTKISNIKDNLTNIKETAEDFTDAISTISGAAESEGFKKIVSVLFKFADIKLLSGLEKITGLTSDLFELGFRPIIDNADVIEDILSTTLDILGELLNPVDGLLDLITANSKNYEDSPLHKFFEWITPKSSKGMRGILEGIADGLERVLDFLRGDVELDDTFDTVFKLITGKLSGNVQFSIRSIFKGTKDISFTSAKKVFDELKDHEIVKTIKGRIADTFKDIKSQYENLKSGEALKTIRGAIGDKFQEIRDAWNNIFSSSETKTIKGYFGEKFEAIRDAWNSIKDKTATLSLKFSAAAADLKEWINTNVIKKVNTAFDNVPILKNINIPYLAQGGYVKANTPQLAMIGDNRHQGEVVSPEGKLVEMARMAAELAGGGGRDAEIIALLKQILTYLMNLNLTATVDVVALKKLIVRLINEHTQATGVCEIYV